MTRRDWSRSARISSSSAFAPSRRKPPSRFRSGSSSASSALPALGQIRRQRRIAASAARELLRQRRRLPSRPAIRAAALQPGQDGTEIARAAAVERQAGQRARHVGHVLQRGAQVARSRPARRAGTAIESSRALIARRIGQRRHQPLGEQTRAAAGHRAVDAPSAASRCGRRTASGRVPDWRGWRDR